MVKVKPILIIWYREILRFIRNRPRIISSLVMPFLWLVMFGSGISGSFSFNNLGISSGFNYVLFLFPGVLGMTVLFTSIFSAISIVRDREFGFLKAILVAPVPRTSIALGKILGGATIASIQGFLIVVLLPLVGIPLKINLLLLLPVIFLVALMMSAFGLFVAAQIRTTEGFQTVMQFVTLPMFMLSGALFPLRNLPSWMNFLSKINPASYGVDLIRHTAFYVLQVPEKIQANFSIVVFDKLITSFLDILIVLFLTIIFTIIATKLFAKKEK